VSRRIENYCVCVGGDVGAGGEQREEKESGDEIVEKGIGDRRGRKKE